MAKPSALSISFLKHSLETSLVSTNLIHDAQHDTSLLLECRSIPEYAPLDYCRFVLPDGTGFSINEMTTANKFAFEKTTTYN